MKKREHPATEMHQYAGGSCPLFYARAGRVAVLSAYGECADASVSNVRDLLDVDAHGFIQRGTALEARALAELEP
jgi:hypothetical protein